MSKSAAYQKRCVVEFQHFGRIFWRNRGRDSNGNPLLANR